MLLTLYRFRFLDPVSGKWVRSRYVATAEDIAARYASYRLEDGPELRTVPDPSELTAGQVQRPFPALAGLFAQPRIRDRSPCAIKHRSYSPNCALVLRMLLLPALTSLWSKLHLRRVPDENTKEIESPHVSCPCFSTIGVSIVSKFRLNFLSSFLSLLFLFAISGCAAMKETIAPTEAGLRTRTANVLGYSPEQIKITNIRSEGTETYWLADTPKGRYVRLVERHLHGYHVNGHDHVQYENLRKTIAER